MIILLLFLYALMHYQKISLSTLNALLLFGKNVLPSIFFYIVLLDILSRINTFDKIYALLFKPLRLFKIRYSSSVFVLFTSFLVGNPANAKSIIDLYDENLIDKNEADYLISSTSFMSIGFSLVYLSSLFPFLTIKIIIINVISNLIIMLISKNKGTIKKESINREKFHILMINDSLKKSFNLLTIILLNMLFFNILCDILLDFNIPSFLLGFIEITKGLKEISNLNIRLILAFSSAFLSFGGICIHLQILSIIKGKISYKKFLIKRIMASIISFY